jgi:plasmid stabilization system protein ParE
LNSDELQQLNERNNAVAALADKIPSGIPYGVREAIAELKLTGLGELVRVGEATFVQEILPALTGEEGTLVDFKWWGFRFGSPFRGFYIVEDNDASKVIFEVPPLLDSNFKLKPAKSARDTVREAAANYANRAYNRPAQAKREFNDALRERIDFSETGRPLKHMVMLDRIFIHYGKPSIFEKVTDPEVLKAVAELKAEQGDTAATPTSAASATPAQQVFSEMDYSDEGMLD